MGYNLSIVRTSAVKTIEDILSKYALDTLYISDIDTGSSPIIYSDLTGYDAESYILDKLYYDTGIIRAEISSCTNVLTYDLDELPTDAIYNILEYLQDHEDDLAEIDSTAGDTNRKEIYDEISRVLTDYEESDGIEESNRDFLKDFYSLLVKIQNNWEDIITSDN